MCGKNRPSDLKKYQRWGSPPRVREKHAVFFQFMLISRITPACAGKTSLDSDLFGCLAGSPPRVREKLTRPSLTLWTGWDHTRVCGKNLFENIDKYYDTGSLPRVREKRFYILRTYLDSRITPACAGKTACLLHRLIRLWDHTRVCGKNDYVAILFGLILGSHPRVREKLRT